jgi:cyanophycinase
VGGGLIVVVAEEDPERWQEALRSAGAVAVSVVELSASPDVGKADGIYVAGGLTPRYRSLLVEGDWLPPDVPYAGFSAGAAIAASQAIVGGWRIGQLVVCDEDAGEDLDQVSTLPGLGLVPFAVDVHATQWGTLTRAVHAVAAGLVAEAVAVDEHTCVSVADGEVVSVDGVGSAYRVTAGGEGVLVRLLSLHCPDLCTLCLLNPGRLPGSGAEA